MNRLIARAENVKRRCGKAHHSLSRLLAMQIASACPLEHTPEVKLWFGVIGQRLDDLFSRQRYRRRGRKTITIPVSTPLAEDAYHWIFGQQGRLVLEMLEIDPRWARKLIEREAQVDHGYSMEMAA